MQFRSDMYVDLMKSDATDFDVTAAARVSTIGADGLDLNLPVEPLINYLMRDRHGSPFEHTRFTFYIEAPIFVAREFFRHRAGWSYNEESGRYKELQPVFYMPHSERPLVQVGKPGAYEYQTGTYRQYMRVNESLKTAYGEAYEHYRAMLAADIAREVARMVLPVGIYTSFYATCNARSLMHFLSLRTKRDNAKVPSFPQLEIQMVADQMEAAFEAQMPFTAAAFDTHGRVAP
ncbi:FAD-dependent thymidylate synthase [Streptomyces graminilatus]|uniref:FAD-dependent thymidylate synthase n=1 Tax=Streptomyces graminilatus TaxID=1464070 RepID=UPI0006E1FE50|nr:FAD-dependent thymidylate synthase [Streptomyces graminilatus]